MAHTAETIEIERTKIKVAIGVYADGDPGVSRTVNVYDHTNTVGNYREVYRLPDSTGITGGSLARSATTLNELDAFLVKLGATKEGPRKA